MLKIEALNVRYETEKPHWGARKIRELLVRRLPGELMVPARSTIHAVLDHHDNWRDVRFEYDGIRRTKTPGSRGPRRKRWETAEKLSYHRGSVQANAMISAVKSVSVLFRRFHSFIDYHSVRL